MAAELEDLVPAMVADAMDTARPMVAGYAANNRRVSGRLRRPRGRRLFDRRTQVWTEPERDLIYEGPARVWPVGSARSMGPEDDTEDVQTTKISLNALPEGRRPQIDDVWTFDDTADTRELQVASAVFLVTGVATGGQFGYGWHLELTGIAPSPNDPEAP